MPDAPNISEKGLRHIWRWARRELADTHEAYMVRLLVVTTLRDRGFPLDDDQRCCLEETLTVLREDARKRDS